MRRRCQSSVQVAGMTLLETTIGIMLVSFLSVGAYGVWSSTADFSKVIVESTSSRDQANRALNRIVGLVANAALTTVTPRQAPPQSSSSVTFQTADGFAFNSVVLGPKTTIRWESEPGDPADGLDNDGDGFVDEGRIVIVIDVDGVARSVDLCNRVARFQSGEIPDGKDNNGNGLRDEPGLAFTLHDGLLRIYLTLLGKDSQDEVVTYSVATALAFRN